MDAEIIHKAGLTEQNSFDQSLANSFSSGEIRTRTGAIQPPVAGRPNTVTPRSAIEGLTK